MEIKRIMINKFKISFSLLLIAIMSLMSNMTTQGASIAAISNSGRTYKTDGGARIASAQVYSDYSSSISAKQPDSDSWYRTQLGLWYYFENDRTTPKKGWFDDPRDGQRYYLDPDTGIMEVGWVQIGSDLYYFNESHNNETNWYDTGNGWFESYGKQVKSYGSMFRNERTPDGQYVDESGRLIERRDDSSGDLALYDSILNNLWDPRDIYDIGDGGENPVGKVYYNGHEFCDLDGDGVSELIIYRVYAYNNVYIDSVYTISNGSPMLFNLAAYGKVDDSKFNVAFGNSLVSDYRSGGTRDEVFYALTDGRVARVSYQWGSLDAVVVYDFKNGKISKNVNFSSISSQIGVLPGTLLNKYN